MTASTPAANTVLLVNLGTPDAPTAAAVRRYLAQFLADRRVVDLHPALWLPVLRGAIVPLRAPRVAANYRKVWIEGRGSPLRVHSQALADAVQARLPACAVALAMRYGQPALGATLRALRERGLQRLLVLPLYPQYSATTTAAVFDALAREFAAWSDVPAVRFVHDYHDEPDWLDAVAASIHAQRGPASGDKLLLSFHGIPERYARRGDPYPQQCEDSAREIARRLHLEPGQWKLAWQSRFGREPWMGPATVDVLREWARAGVRRVDVACPGFAVDCLETLEEIALRYAEAFVQSGGANLRYLPALNASAAHADALASIARRHLGGWPA